MVDRVVSQCPGRDQQETCGGGIYWVGSESACRVPPSTLCTRACVVVVEIEVACVCVCVCSLLALASGHQPRPSTRCGQSFNLHLHSLRPRDCSHICTRSVPSYVVPALSHHHHTSSGDLARTPSIAIPYYPGLSHLSTTISWSWDACADLPKSQPRRRLQVPPAHYYFHVHIPLWLPQTLRLYQDPWIPELEL